MPIVNDVTRKQKRSLEYAGSNSVSNIDSLIIDRQLMDAFNKAGNNYINVLTHEREKEEAEEKRLIKKWGLPLGYIASRAKMFKSALNDKYNQDAPYNKALRELNKANDDLINFRNKKQ